MLFMRKKRTRYGDPLELEATYGHAVVLGL
jgi:hypothetical protein